MDIIGFHCVGSFFNVQANKATTLGHCFCILMEPMMYNVFIYIL